MLRSSRYPAKSKMTRSQSNAVDMKLQILELLLEVEEYYSNAEISADVIFANDEPFLTSISEDTYYHIISAVDNLKCP